MENQQKPTKKIALNYGLYFGISSIIIGVIRYALGMQYEKDTLFGIVSLVLMLLFVVLGIKKFKEANNGFLTLGQGIKTGVGIALIGGIIGIIYTLLFISVIEPEFMSNKLEMARQQMLDNPKYTDEIIDKSMEMQKKFSSPLMISAFGLIWTLFIGFIISLISGAIMQRKPEEY